MGYNLYIGEFDFTVHAEDRYVSVGVVQNDGKSVGAPLNSSDNRSNECWPSYTQWVNFARDVGLASVFFGDGDRYPWFSGDSGEEYSGLVTQHPGAARLTSDHLAAFQRAKDSYEQRPEGKQNEYILRRLTWLVWWTEWALKNCKHPTFANS